MPASWGLGGIYCLPKVHLHMSSKLASLDVGPFGFNHVLRAQLAADGGGVRQLRRDRGQLLGSRELCASPGRVSRLQVGTPQVRIGVRLASALDLKAVVRSSSRVEEDDEVVPLTSG